MTVEQVELLKLLEKFDRVCKENHLNYFVEGGTLLGAIRHHGFIPWDDDIDVSMPVEDYIRLLEIPLFPEGVVLQSEQTDPAYPFVFAKFCNTRIPFFSGAVHGPLGVYLDIFPIIPSKPPQMDARLAFSILLVIGYVLQSKCNWTKFVPYKKWTARIGYSLLSLLSIRQLRGIRNKLIGYLYQPQAAEWCCSPGGVYHADKEFNPANWYSKTELLQFETMQVPGIAEWDAYLTRHYGDYLTPPPEAEQIPHHKNKDE